MRPSSPAVPDKDPVQVVDEFWDYFESLVSRRGQQLAVAGKSPVTWKELAEKVDISNTTLSDWRRKHALPANSFILIKIAVFLGADETDCRRRWREARGAYERVVAGRQTERKPDKEENHGPVPDAGPPPNSKGDSAEGGPPGRDIADEGESPGHDISYGGASTDAAGPARRHNWRRPSLVLVGALAVVLASFLTPLHSWVDRHFLHAGSAAKSALTATAEPETLDDQGSTMAAAYGRRPSQQILHQMSRPLVTASQRFLQEIRSDGGVNVESSTVQVVVNGLSRKGVRIMDIRPVALRRTAPLGGTLYYIPSQAGNATIRMMFDLDERIPLARQDDRTATPGTGDPQQSLAGFIIGVHPGDSFFDAETIHLAYHEQQVLNIRIQVTHFYATFDLEIDYHIGTDSRTLHKLTVTDDGQPFTITGIPPGPRPGTATYQQAFLQQGNYSLCRASDPGQIPLGATAPPPRCLKSRNS